MKGLKNLPGKFSPMALVHYEVYMENVREWEVARQFASRFSAKGEGCSTTRINTAFEGSTGEGVKLVTFLPADRHQHLVFFISELLTKAGELAAFMLADGVPLCIHADGDVESVEHRTLPASRRYSDVSWGISGYVLED